MKRLLSLTALTLLLVASLSATPLGAQKAHSVPVSNQVIVLELAHPDGEVTKAAVREGSMLKARDTEAGWYYGFTPVLDEEDDVLVTVFRITEVSSGHERLQEVAQEKAAIAEKNSTAMPQGFSVRVLRVFEAPFDEEDASGRDAASPDPEKD